MINTNLHFLKADSSHKTLDTVGYFCPGLHTYLIHVLDRKGSYHCISSKMFPHHIYILVHSISTLSFYPEKTRPKSDISVTARP